MNNTKESLKDSVKILKTQYIVDKGYKLIIHRGRNTIILGTVKDCELKFTVRLIFTH